jgi:hypothetical protein
MPAPVNQYIKLKEIIFGYSESAKQSESEFRRLWRLAFKGFKQMGLNVFWYPETFLLSVDQNTKTADLPDSYLQWIKIGQFNAGGELQTLRVNEQLTVFHDALPTRLTDILPEIQDAAGALQSELWYSGFNTFTGFEGGYGTQPNLAWGSKLVQFGECWIDVKQRKIILDPNYQYQDVVLECIVQPELYDDYTVPMQMEMAFHTWLGVWDIAMLPATNHVNNNNLQMRMRLFKGQHALACRMMKPIRLQELYQELVEAQNLGIKP